LLTSFTTMSLTLAALEFSLTLRTGTYPITWGRLRKVGSQVVRQQGPFVPAHRLIHRTEQTVNDVEVDLLRSSVQVFVKGIGTNASRLGKEPGRRAFSVKGSRLDPMCLVGVQVTLDERQNDVSGDMAGQRFLLFGFTGPFLP
jgi:hypothetical protein